MHTACRNIDYPDNNHTSLKMKPMFDVFQSFYHFGKKSLQFAFFKNFFVHKGGGERLLRLPPAHAPDRHLDTRPLLCPQTHIL
jgi:hypothetical protein